MAAETMYLNVFFSSSIYLSSWPMPLHTWSPPKLCEWVDKIFMNCTTLRNYSDSSWYFRFWKFFVRIFSSCSLGKAQENTCIQELGTMTILVRYGGKTVREGFPKKSCCSFGFCPDEGGALHAQIFWHLFLRAFFVYFLQNANNLNFRLFFRLYT